MNIADRIFSKRTSLGLSKAALAKAIGVSDVSVGKWESGINQPKGRYLNDLAAALGVSVNWLLTGDDRNTQSNAEFIVSTLGSGTTGEVLMAMHKFLKGMNAEEQAAFFSEAASSGLARLNPSLANALLILGGAERRAIFSKIEPAALPQGVAEEQAGFSNFELAVIPQGRRVPILSYVQAGNWREMCEQASSFDGNVEYVTAGVDIGPCGFGLWLRGDSMAPRFNEGDLVIVDPDEQPRPGDYVVATDGKEGATFKKFRPRGVDDTGNEVFELVPLNEDYPKLYSDRQPIAVIGVMMEHRIFRKR